MNITFLIEQVERSLEQIMIWNRDVEDILELSLFLFQVKLACKSALSVFITWILNLSLLLHSSLPKTVLMELVNLLMIAMDLLIVVRDLLVVAVT